MATAHAWAEGTEYKGQAEYDDHDFCTVGEVTYICRWSHTAAPDTHPTQGKDGRKTWEQAARVGLDGLNSATRDLKSALGVVQCSRKRLAPATLNEKERERFAFLSDWLRTHAETLAAEIEQMISEHPQDAPEVAKPTSPAPVVRVTS